MSHGSDQFKSPEIVQLATVGTEHSGYHGHMHSTAGLRLMGKAATAAATSLLNMPMIALSTERVAFLAPVPVGHMIAFRSEVAVLGDDRFRVSVEGMTRLGNGASARCVMTGSFLLVAVDEEGRPISTPNRRLAAQVA